MKQLSDEEKEYRRIRRVFLLNPKNKFCKARIPGICMGTRVQGIELDIHHIKGRLGSLLFDTRNFLPVCRVCHKWLHDHPIEAKELGFSEDRLIKEDE